MPKPRPSTERLALAFTEEAIRLLVRRAGGWELRAEATLSGGASRAQLRALLAEAERIAGHRPTAALWLPPEHVLVLRLPVAGLARAARRDAAEAALAERLGGDAKDCRWALGAEGEDGCAPLAAALGATVSEASAYAERWGFAPGRTTAAPSVDFPDGPDFAPPSVADRAAVGPSATPAPAPSSAAGSSRLTAAFAAVALLVGAAGGAALLLRSEAGQPPERVVAIAPAQPAAPTVAPLVVPSSAAEENTAAAGGAASAPTAPEPPAAAREAAQDADLAAMPRLRGAATAPRPTVQDAAPRAVEAGPAREPAAIRLAALTPPGLLDVRPAASPGDPRPPPETAPAAAAPDPEPSPSAPAASPAPPSELASAPAGASASAPVTTAAPEAPGPPLPPDDLEAEFPSAPPSEFAAQTPRPPRARPERPDPDATATALAPAAAAAPPGRPVRLVTARAAAVNRAEGAAPGTSVGRGATIADAIRLDETAVLGVFGGPDGREALVRTPDGAVQRVRRGDRVRGWTVSAISGSSVELRNGPSRRLVSVPE